MMITRASSRSVPIVLLMAVLVGKQEIFLGKQEIFYFAQSQKIIQIIIKSSIT